MLKKCHENGWIYKGRDAVPWCPRCGTAISQHEILTEEYKEITHESVFFKLPIGGREKEFFLVWTTTPWTIPANVAIAVNPKYIYARVKVGEEIFILTKERLEVLKEKYEILEELAGDKLEGLHYDGPFDELPRVRETKDKNKNFHTVILADESFVTTEEGTGIVHVATGAGTEDFQLGKKLGLPVLEAIDESAFYIDGYGELSAQNAKNKPELIFDYLKNYKNGIFLYKIEPYAHRYPTCWRCKTELVWRVVDEWYIKMDELREQMKEVIKKINWMPKWGYDRELDWLKNMSDWLISKKRYWGLALPIWECTKCGHFAVIGSYEELKQKATEGWDKFVNKSPHKPQIDAIKIKCEKCGEIMKRIPDVGNPWLDAGIVSFSTLKYTTDKNYWEKWFPGDFITQCFAGHSKNWFYSFLAMSTVLENTNPFRKLLGHAEVRDEKGEGMHKSKGNAIAFDEAAEKMGADVMRWMYTTQDPEQNLNFGYNVANEVRRKFHLTLWNIYNFFVSYANVDKFQIPQPKAGPPLAENPKNILDRWVVSRLHETLKEVTNSLDTYDAYKASHQIEGFVQDLSTWYVRRSRDRIGPTVDDAEDKNACYETLHYVLKTLCLMLAPFTPFLAEEMWQNLTGGEFKPENSVHLQDWPKYDESLIDAKLNEEMVLAREICEHGHSLRKEAGIKVRQPLNKFKIQNSKLTRDELLQLIKDELNVKEVELAEGKEEMKGELDTEITLELKKEGEARDIMRQIQEARKEAGCRLDEQISVEFPDWPCGLSELLQKEVKHGTLAKEISLGKEIKIIRE